MATAHDKVRLFAKPVTRDGRVGIESERFIATYFRIVVGLGAMGSAIAKRLLNAGFDVTVFNRTVRKADPLARAGANVAESPAALVRDSNVVISCLLGPDSDRIVYLGDSGLLSGDVAGRLFVNTSTCGADLARTLQEIRKYRHAFLMFIAMLLYQDGIQTIIRMAGVYGAEVGIEQTSQIAAFVMVQFVGIPFSFLFGALGSRLGTKRCIFIAIAVYALATILAFFMTSAVHFFALAFLIGTVQGGAQALSRALFARLIPRDRTSEFFGFFAVAERFATVFGPAIFTISVMLTGNSKSAILAILGLFSIWWIVPMAVREVGVTVLRFVLLAKGSVVASDAFFPFRDGLDVVAAAGVSAVIQPGGSVRDAEVVAAADEHGLAMVFTGLRHFRH